jgi:hypothetical protein
MSVSPKRQFPPLEILPELPRTPTNKIQKHVLRRPGVTAATWDRQTAGFQLQEEIRRAELRAQRRAPERPLPAPDPADSCGRGLN